MEAAGIQHDHSLRYADHIDSCGNVAPARSMPCQPHVEPDDSPCFSDGRHVESVHGLDSGPALDALEQLAREVKDVEGQLTLLWHNETVSECNEWKGWRTVYEQVFERVC